MIRYNWFHDMLGYGYEKGKWVSPHFAWGIYLDDNSQAWAMDAEGSYRRLQPGEGRRRSAQMELLAELSTRPVATL